MVAIPLIRKLHTVRNPFGWRTGLVFGAVVLAVFLACAIFAPLLAPHSPYTQSLADRLIPPVYMEGGTWNHPLGTDNLGRDYLSRLIYGARVSLFIGIVTVLISGTIGITLGVVAGYFGGRIDLLVGFIINVRLSLPLILVALAVVAIIGNALYVIVLVLAGLLWDRFAVISRALTLQLREREFVLSAKAAGATDRWIIVSEILPSLMQGVIVIATLEVAQAILLEAALSFLGLGVRPPTASWGQMIAEAKDMVFFEPWLINIPGFALLLLVLAVNLLGNGLDQALSGGRSRLN